MLIISMESRDSANTAQRELKLFKSRRMLEINFRGNNCELEAQCRQFLFSNRCETDSDFVISVKRTRQVKIGFLRQRQLSIVDFNILDSSQEKAKLSAFKSKFITKFEIISSRKKCVKNRNEFDSLNLLYLKVLFFSDTLNL